MFLNYVRYTTAKIFFCKNLADLATLYIVVFMRLHRFFVSSPIGKNREVILRDKDLFHQLKHVFRFTIGGQVILFDDSGFDYHAMIASFRPNEVTLSIVSRQENKSEPNREIFLFASLLKKDKFEWILEKGTELGVSHFIPVISLRAEKKSLNYERAKKIIQEATEQSGRSHLPLLHETVFFEDALMQEFPCFAFDQQGDTFTIEHAQKFSPLGLFVGPEGGWADQELFLFKKNNIKIYSLGAPTLRAETASIAVASLILLQ